MRKRWNAIADRLEALLSHGLLSLAGPLSLDRALGLK